VNGFAPLTRGVARSAGGFEIPPHAFGVSAPFDKGVNRPADKGAGFLPLTRG
jgi:hypothetical protein